MLRLKFMLLTVISPDHGKVFSNCKTFTVNDKMLDQLYCHYSSTFVFRKIFQHWLKVSVEEALGILLGDFKSEFLTVLIPNLVNQESTY
jgi:hypothetical protein